MKNILDEATIATILSIRTRHRNDLRKLLRRHDWRDVGGCWLVAGDIAYRFGWDQIGGCYVLPDGTHESHEWNLLPDGRIIDATADQFGAPSPGIRVVGAGDPRYNRDCYCSL